MKHTGKIIAGVLVAALVAAVIWRLWESGESGAPGGGGGRSAAAIAVETAPVERRDLRETRGFTGTLEAESGFDVVARVSGRLLSLDYDIGDRVERGVVVARMEDDEYVQALRQAEAEREMAEANIGEAESALLVAERELERVRALRQRDIASEADLDAAEAQLQAARARLRVARATLAQREAAEATARLRLSYTEVRASWEAGPGERAVAERFVSEGANVASGEPLLSLVNLRTLRGVIFVTERDFSLVRAGQEAEVRVDALPGKVFPARVARVAPVFQAGSRQARVELEVDNSEERLGPGMFARVGLRLREAPNAIAVPLDSVVRRSGEDGVFLVDGEENRARFVPVELGIRDGLLVEVRSPELSGTIVTLGHDQLTDGAAVRVVGGEREPVASARVDG